MFALNVTVNMVLCTLKSAWNLLVKGSVERVAADTHSYKDLKKRSSSLWLSVPSVPML